MRSFSTGLSYSLLIVAATASVVGVFDSAFQPVQYPINAFHFAAVAWALDKVSKNRSGWNFVSFVSVVATMCVLYASAYSYSVGFTMTDAHLFQVYYGTTKPFGNEVSRLTTASSASYGVYRARYALCFVGAFFSFFLFWIRMCVFARKTTKNYLRGSRYEGKHDAQGLIEGIAIKGRTTPRITKSEMIKYVSEYMASVDAGVNADVFANDFAHRVLSDDKKVGGVDFVKSLLTEDVPHAAEILRRFQSRPVGIRIVQYFGLCLVSSSLVFSIYETPRWASSDSPHVLTFAAVVADFFDETGSVTTWIMALGLLVDSVSSIKTMRDIDDAVSAINAMNLPGINGGAGWLDPTTYRRVFTYGTPEFTYVRLDYTQPVDFMFTFFTEFDHLSEFLLLCCSSALLAWRVFRRLDL